MNNNFGNFLIFLVICFIFWNSNVYAEGMIIKPGLWETKSIVTLPFEGGTQEHTSQDCMQEHDITPQKLMEETQGCTILESNVDRDSMQWKISCNSGGVEMLGEGNAESAKTTINGGMIIKASLNGQEITMTTNWQGKLIGDC